MNDSEESTDKSVKKWYIYILLASLLSGGGSLGINSLTSSVRNDSFTGAQGKELKELMYNLYGEQTKRIDEKYKEISKIDDKLVIALSKTYTKDQIRERITDIKHRIEKVDIGAKTRCARMEKTGIKVNEDIRHI